MDAVDDNSFSILYDAIKSIVEIPVTTGGHGFSGENFAGKDFCGVSVLMAEEHRIPLTEAIRTKQPCEPVELKYCSNRLPLQCFNCGKRLQWTFDGIEVKCKTKCRFRNGVPDLVFEIDVPSGKMVVTNDLRSIFQIKDHSISTLVAEFAYTKAYARKGMAHAFVGNSCPGMFQLPCRTKLPSRFAIGRLANKNVKRVASICTDLWWYSICDADRFEKNSGKKAKKDDFLDIVKCKPGRYRFTHVVHKIDRDEDGAVYTTIERVK